MFSSVHSLLERSFFPCSPLAASLGLSQSRQFWTWAWVRSLLLEQTALAALDSEDEVGASLAWPSPAGNILRFGFLRN